MLFAFFGTDTQEVRKKAQEFLHDQELAEAGITVLTTEMYTPGFLESAVGSVSLFGDQEVYVIDTPSEDKEVFDHVFGNLDLLAESKNTFVLIEKNLLAPQKKKLQKYAATCSEFVGEKIERFNVFGLADAFLRRDRKALFVLLAQAKRNGLSEEEIIGTLLWQIKSLRLAERAKSASEAGLKPFVWSKAKGALIKFKEGELDGLSRALVMVYHEGHLGKQDLELALERWVLTI